MFRCIETCFADRLYVRGKVYASHGTAAERFFQALDAVPKPETPKAEPPRDYEREKTLTPEEVAEERASLKEQLDMLGVEYDTRWGLKRLRATLEGASG